MELPLCINRRILCKYVRDKINNIINIVTIINVINILIDEMVEDIFNKKKINIKNFGIIYLKKTVRRRRYCVVRRCVRNSGNYKKLHFDLDDRIKADISNNLSADSIVKQNPTVKYCVSESKSN